MESEDGDGEPFNDIIKTELVEEEHTGFYNPIIECMNEPNSLKKPNSGRNHSKDRISSKSDDEKFSEEEESFKEPRASFDCNLCVRTFSEASRLKRHKLICGQYYCHICKHSFFSSKVNCL